jgi:hypothetical protein
MLNRYRERKRKNAIACYYSSVSPMVRTQVSFSHP